MALASAEDVPLFARLIAYWTYFLAVVTGYLHAYLVRMFSLKQELPPAGYAALLDDFNAFYTRYLYGRISDCWNRPIKSTPGAWIDVLERTGSDMTGDLRFTGKTNRILNLASYNYLGFAENSGKCTTEVSESMHNYSTSTCAPRLAFGTTEIHRECERLVARFVGKEDAAVFGMGYATNSTSLAALVGQGGLIISDSLNHASLVVGIRCASAKVCVFNHNDPKDLERVLRNAIRAGQPRTRRPWTKILIVVEGIYSMEGEILRLPEIVEIKKKYKAYLYVDEAHSIGALGKSGRGVCDYWGVNPADIDILMGTFTKSFGSCGGYIAGSKEVIDRIRVASFSSVYDTAMSVPAVQQVISSMRILLGEDGTDEGHSRIVALRRNSNYFRRRLVEMGFMIVGDDDSPIVPMMIYVPSAMPVFSRASLEAKLGVVIVGYPATPLLLSRVRYCISAAHTIQDLEDAVQTIARLGKACCLQFGTEVPLEKQTPLMIEDEKTKQLVKCSA